MVNNSDDFTCVNGRCYGSRWDAKGRWVVVGFVIFWTAVVLLSCFVAGLRRRRRCRRAGLAPATGTGWFVPKNRYSTHQTYYGQELQPGPPGPPGYYPPPPPPGQDAYGNFYTPPAPPYTPNPIYAGSAAESTRPQSNGAYFAPPQGPPPAHGMGQAHEMEPQQPYNGPSHNRSPVTPPPTVPVQTHPTSTSTHSYVQSNNPFQPPASPPPVHATDMHGAAVGGKN